MFIQDSDALEFILFALKYRYNELAGFQIKIYNLLIRDAVSLKLIIMMI